MPNLDHLIDIREKWLKRVSNSLAREERVRGALMEELNRFYDLLLQAIESGDPGWLKPILFEWGQSRTETDLENYGTIPPIMSQIVENTVSIAREELSPEDALGLIEAIMPILNYCYEQISYQESIVRIAYLSTKIDRLKQDLAMNERSKSDFISIAAHELKTPLTLIEGYTSMMREQFPRDDEESAGVLLLKGVSNGTRRLGEIINDMIDVSIIDNQLLTLNFQPTWINRLLEVLQADVKDTVEERGQTLEIRDFDGAEDMTYADSERIFQALRNVLTNAIKYTPDGGKITVDGRKLAGFIEVIVSDSGIGIDPKYHTRIFEKFGLTGDVALHSSGKTKFKGGGPGLGLPITKGIMDAHGGTIWVESEGYNEETFPGSTFHILIPLRTELPDITADNVFQKYVDMPSRKDGD